MGTPNVVQSKGETHLQSAWSRTQQSIPKARLPRFTVTRMIERGDGSAACSLASSWTSAGEWCEDGA